MALNNLPVSQFCVFCYRKYSSQIPDDKIDSLVLFTKLLGRHLGDQQLEQLFNFKSVTGFSSCKIVCCFDCSSQTEQFTSLYHQYKLLELKLQWQIIKVVNIIRLANKVPSRISELKNALEIHVINDQKRTNDEFSELKRVKVFRKEIIEKCRTKLAQSQPRVLLTAMDSILKLSSHEILHNDKTVCTVDHGINLKTPAITTKTITELANEAPVNDVNQVSSKNSITAVEPHQSSIDEISATITEDLNSICSKNKLNIDKAQVKSSKDIGFDPMPILDVDSVNDGKIGNASMLEPINVNNDAVTENSASVCFEEIFEDTHSLTNCDIDPLNEDSDDHGYVMEYNDCDDAEVVHDNIITTENGVSCSVQALKNHISTQEESLISPNTIPTDSTFSCEPQFKLEWNAVNHSALETVSPEHISVLPEAVITNEEVHKISTRTVNDNLIQNVSNLDQIRQAIYPIGHQTSFPNEKSKTTEIRHGTTANTEDNEKSTRKNIDESEPQQRYNLRKKHVQNIAVQLDDDFSDNDNDEEFLDENASSSSSSSSYSDSESKEVTHISSGMKRKRYTKNNKLNNGTRSSSKEPETITCPDGCAKVFQNEQMYQNHLKLHSSGQFQCKFCQVLLQNVLDLSAHEYKDHCPNDFNIDKQKQCPRCLLKFDFPFEYEEHFAYTHFGIGDIPNTKTCDGSVPPSNKRNLFMCRRDACDKKFRNEKLYHDHRKLHTKGSYPCKFCKIVASSVINLAYHEHQKHSQTKTKLTKGKQCPRCSFEFKYSFDYEDHFAYTYFGIGENPETKQKRREKGQSRYDPTNPPEKYRNHGLVSCKICKRRMPKSQVDSHIKQWHDSKTECKIKPCNFEGCQAYFLTDKQLQSHSISHREEITTFSCNICKSSFARKLLLRRHLRQKHNQYFIQDIGSEHQPNQLPCNFCEFTTNVPRNLAIHEEKEHSDETEDDLDKNSKKRHCPRCPYKYDVQSCYIIHHLSKHLDLLSINNLNACKLCSGSNSFVLNSFNHFNKCHNLNLLEDPSKIFKCDVENCPAYFLQSNQLYSHKTRMHPILNCLKCVKTFKTRGKLLKHLLRCQKSYALENHPNLSVSCDNPTCIKMFHNEDEMKKHKIVAHPKNPKPQKEMNEICPKCEKRFFSIRRLKYHMTKAHVERSFVCSDCGKMLQSQSHLDIHMRFHKGPDAWEYQCSECGKKCFDKHKLGEHLRTHTKEKPFICQFCGGKYAHRHNWRNHLKTKHADEEGVDEIVGKGKKGNYLSRKGSKKGECITGNKMVS